jgi:hypothetical protein
MSKFKVGDEVQISDESGFRYQGIDEDGEKMRGVIKNLDSSGWWRVTWDDDTTNTYLDEDLEPYVTTLISEPEENITFTVNGKTFNYSLASTFYSITTDVNDVIFNELGLDKDLFCSKAYGYESLDGSWPEWRDGDNEAPIKIVKAIREKIKERESMSKSESTTEQTLLKEARRLYPIGTKYHPIGSDGIKCFGDNIQEATYECRWVESGLGIYCGIGYVYANGKWAEIVSETKAEPTTTSDFSIRYSGGTIGIILPEQPMVLDNTSSNITIGRSAFDGSMVYRKVTKQLPETQEPIIISKKEKKKKILVL